MMDFGQEHLLFGERLLELALQDLPLVQITMQRLHLLLQGEKADVGIGSRA